MKTNRYNTLVRSWMFLFLAFVVMSFIASPVTAAASASAPDVTKIDAFVSEQVRRHGLPGVALGLVEGDRIIRLQGFGKADQTGRAVTPQTPFDLASVSKPLTALAIMLLVEAGKVELDAPVQRYVPDFQLADPVASVQITVRHLLEHTSGIPVTACDTRVGAVTLAQYVAELRTVPLAHPVGARHDYCSGNYNVLGRVIEMVSGRAYGDYMAQHVFAPLAMQHTFTALTAAQQAGLAQEYQWLFGLAVPAQTHYTPSQLPSGYVMASAEDMCHFLIALLTGGRYGAASILSANGIAAMQAPGVPTGANGETYGLGLVSGGSIGGVPIIHHDGGHANTRAFLFIEPDNHRGAVLLINSFGLLPDAAFTEIEVGVARLLAGQEPLPPSALSLPMLYLIVDVVFALLLAFVAWPLFHLRHWGERFAQNRQAGRPQLLRVGLRLGWEFFVPLALLIGVRLLLTMLGAQSWYQGLITFPDLVGWLWVISLLLLLTGVLRGAVVLRVLRRNDGGYGMMATSPVKV